VKFYWFISQAEGQELMVQLFTGILKNRLDQAALIPEQCLAAFVHGASITLSMVRR